MNLSVQVSGSLKIGQQTAVLTAMQKIARPALLFLAMLLSGGMQYAAHASEPADKPNENSTSVSGRPSDQAGGITRTPGSPDLAETFPGTEVSLPPIDVWERVRTGFAISGMEHKELKDSTALYSQHPDYLYTIVERSKRYLFHIVEQLQQRGMPTEIALIPIIESAYNPLARSSDYAGLWQIGTVTGKNFQLRQNWWSDDRHHVIASTRAVLDYFQYLHRMFGDWNLAVVAYNWGEGSVSRALSKSRRKGLSPTYQNISLPAVTQQYIARLAALKAIISSPQTFQVALQSVPNQPYFVPVDIARHMDATLAAHLAGIVPEELHALNPSHKRPVMHIDSTHPLLLPADKVHTFSTNLQQYDKPLTSWQMHRVQQGETLQEIAARYHISLTQLQAVNGIDKQTRSAPATTLLVPFNESENRDDTARISVRPDTKTEKSREKQQEPLSHSAQ